MTKLARSTLIVLLSFGSPAAAQRYRVVVADEGSTRVSVVEFRPCVPAETSDCGAWLVETSDTAKDSARPPRERVPSVVSRRARATIAIRASSVVVMPMSPGERVVTVSGTHGTPLSLAVSGDGAYVFGIFAGAAGRPPELEMIDLNTCTVWAIFPLAARPAALAMG